MHREFEHFSWTVTTAGKLLCNFKVKSLLYLLFGHPVGQKLVQRPQLIVRSFWIIERIVSIRSSNYGHWMTERLLFSGNLSLQTQCTIVYIALCLIATFEPLEEILWSWIKGRIVQCTCFISRFAHQFVIRKFMRLVLLLRVLGTDVIALTQCHWVAVKGAVCYIWNIICYIYML